jgi:hypothetical protein
MLVEHFQVFVEPILLLGVVAQREESLDGVSKQAQIGRVGTIEAESESADVALVSVTSAL